LLYNITQVDSWIINKQLHSFYYSIVSNGVEFSAADIKLDDEKETVIPLTMDLIR